MGLPTKPSFRISYRAFERDLIGHAGQWQRPGSHGRERRPGSGQEPPSTIRAPAAPITVAALAQCFMRVSHLDRTLLDRVGRYEARLWRQAAQAIWTLEAMRHPGRALQLGSAEVGLGLTGSL